MNVSVVSGHLRDVKTPHAHAVAAIVLASLCFPSQVLAGPAAEVAGCVIGFAGELEGLSTEELRVAITLEARKYELAERVRLRAAADGQVCTPLGDDAVRVQIWPNAMVELEARHQRVRLELVDVPPRQRADAVARALVELLEPASPDLQLVPASLPQRSRVAPVVAHNRGRLVTYQSADVDTWDYRPAGSWIALGMAVDMESRSGFHARTGMDIAGAASLVNGRMDIGVWATFYPTAEVVPTLEERGGDVVFFMGYNHVLPLHLEARFRFGAGFSYREVTHVSDALVENATLDPAVRAEIELRWRFASFAHVGVSVGARGFVTPSNYRLQDGSVLDASAGSGLFGLRLGVDL